MDNRIQKKFKTHDGRYIKIHQRVPVRGTTIQQKKALAHVITMLDTLFTRGRLDILRHIANRTLTLMQVRDAFDAGKLESLLGVENILPIDPYLFEWLEKHDVAENTRAGYRSVLKSLLTFAPKNAVIADIVSPEKGELRMLERMRLACEKNGKRHNFNQARTALMAFFKNNFGRSNLLYNAVFDLPALPEKRKEKNPLSIGEVLEIMEGLSAGAGKIFWTLCHTGMNCLEYSNGWQVDGDTVVIHGTKRDARDRIVPLIVPASEIYKLPKDATRTGAGRFVQKDGEWKYQWKETERVAVLTHQPWYAPFLRELRKVSKKMVQPHDCRRTFARWMEECYREDHGGPIIESHRNAYMGHGKSITTLYNTPRVRDSIIATDRKKLLAYIKEETTKYYAERKKQIKSA